MEIMRIETDNMGNQIVSGRELHEFLESKRDFTTWMKDRIEKYGFIENEDFTLHKFVEGKTWTHDYILKLDTAKEISMVEGNDKGKMARRYFIAREKQAIALQQKLLNLAPEKALTADFEKQMIAVKYQSDILGLKDTDKIILMSLVYKKNDIPTDILPAYSKEESEEAVSLTTLFRERGKNISAKKANEILLEEGYLEEMTRPSSKGEVKKYKKLTDKGLLYGKNQISPQNPKEVQPAYYRSRFDELERMITDKIFH